MKVKSVKHIQEYLLEVSFENGTVRQIDLKNFLLTAKNPMTTKFRDIELFKNVRIEYGHLSWGDGEMDLSAESLYNWKD
jgi:hypothetical protein